MVYDISQINHSQLSNIMQGSQMDKKNNQYSQNMVNQCGVNGRAYYEGGGGFGNFGDGGDREQ